MRSISCFSLILLSLAFSAPAFSQVAVQVQSAEMAVPFGSIPGRVVLAGEMLIFVDEQNLENSFGFTRANVKEVRTEGEAVIVDLHKPVRDRSGERSRLSFRTSEEAGSGFLTTWFGREAPLETPAVAEESREEGRAQTYQVSHSHTFGSCSGRLIVSSSRLVYESVSNVGDSRRWDMADIKEVELNNPYELVVKPFNGSNYKFKLEREGMDSSVYRQLVENVTNARASRR